MSLIAIADCDQTFSLLKHIYASAQSAWASSSENEGSLHSERSALLAPGVQSPVITLLNDQNNSPDIDILVLNSVSESADSYAASLKEGGFLLLNADEKPAKRKIKLKSAIPISYGFDSKSSITSSSISHGAHKTMQICIQRPIPTVLGKTVMEQEFSIRIASKEINDHSILAAVTAAIVNDFPPGAFSFLHILLHQLNLA